MTMAEKQTFISLIEAAKGIMDLLFGTKADFKKAIRNPDEYMQDILNVID